MLELPGGSIRSGENVYECLRRELNSEGFKVTKIFGENKSNELRKDDEELMMFNPFCISQRIEGKKSIISNIILCKIDVEEVNNKSKFKYVCTEDLEDMLVNHKEKISSHSIGSLKLFCKSLKGLYQLT